ncbi:MAG: AAA family ATPase [Planctomycetaceae bacterium]|nr:AAA family ATPase [Planctomycetaceae bacterium]
MKDEVLGALEGLPGSGVVVHAADTLARAVEVARSRQPHICLLEMTPDMAELKAVAAEVRAVCPETSVVAAWQPDAFPRDVWEKTSQGAIFVDGIRAGITDFLRRPLSTGDLRQLLVRLQTTPAMSTAPARRGTTLAFVSNKGGVGKSTLSVNVATRLAQRHPDDVLLIDTSLQMGLCATMLNLRPDTSILDAVREPDRLDTSLLRRLTVKHSSGLDLLAAPSDPIYAAEIDDEMIARILSMARRTYQYVVIDTFPLFDRIVMAVLDFADRAYVVLDNVVPTVISAQRLLELMDAIDYPVERRSVVVNRFARVSGNPGLDDVERQLKHSVDHVLPFDKRAMTAANLGEPFALSPRAWSKLERGLRELIDDVERFAAKSSFRAEALAADGSAGSENNSPAESTDGKRNEILKSSARPAEDAL